MPARDPHFFTPTPKNPHRNDPDGPQSSDPAAHRDHAIVSCHGWGCEDRDDRLGAGDGLAPEETAAGLAVRPSACHAGGGGRRPEGLERAGGVRPPKILTEGVLTEGVLTEGRQPAPSHHDRARLVGPPVPCLSGLMGRNRATPPRSSPGASRTVRGGSGAYAGIRGSPAGTSYLSLLLFQGRVQPLCDQQGLLEADFLVRHGPTPVARCP